MAIIQPIPPDRNHIVKRTVKHWAKHWCVGPNEIQSAIEKVGNSVAAVQKELQLRGLIQVER